MGYTTGTKWNIDLVREMVESKGFILVSKEYVNAKTKLIFYDSDGYYYNQVLSNNDPIRYAKSNPYTIQNIKLWCKLNNKPFELISEKYEGNTKHLKWKCFRDWCNEVFEASWSNISNHTHNKGCPYCAGVKVGQSNCLATKNPELAKEWHPTKNGNLTPYDVTCGSGKDVWWQCNKNPKHEWQAIINSRNDEKGCPYCSHKIISEDNNFKVTNPILALEWNYTRNDKSPEEYAPNSGDFVWWQCKDNSKHEWQDTIAHRNDKKENRNCPYCSGHRPSEDYNLLIDNPKLCEEWDYSKNIKNPEELTPNSGKYAWWICKDCKHEWYATIDSRNKNNGTSNGCPECNKSKGEKKCKEVFLCKMFFEITQVKYDNLSDTDKNNNTYFISQKTFNGLVGLGNGSLSYDFYLPKYNCLIEYQGQYHDGTVSNQTEEQFKYQQEHDRRKKEYAQNNNINLLEIWYWDFDNIEEILSKYLKIQQEQII